MGLESDTLVSYNVFIWEGKAMNFKLKLIVTSNDSHIESTHEILLFEKDSASIEQLGLTLPKSKTILKELQAVIVGSQINQFIQKNNFCSECESTLNTKGHTTVQLKTLFGNILINCPRFYNCKCTSSSHTSFNPLQRLTKNKDYISPELYYMESKLASLMSYGLTADLLKECFPINEKINAEVIRQHAKKISERIEADLGEEHYIYALSLPILMDFKAYNNESATVGIDMVVI